MKGFLPPRICLLLLTVLLGHTGAFEIHPPPDHIIQQWEDIRLYFEVKPWPPPCPPCKPNDPSLQKYEVVNVYYLNETNGGSEEICHAKYVNGTFDATTGKCSQQNSRVSDFDPNIKDGVLLEIESCTIYDEGSYTVLIKYGAPDVQNSSKLYVHFPPLAPDIVTEPPNGTVHENEELTLTCTVSNANPFPTLAWYRRQNGATEQPPHEYHNATSWDDETVNIIKIKPNYHDHGVTYECLAWNYLNANQPMSTGQAIVVYHKPYSQIAPCYDTSDTGSPYYVEEGRTATFTCEVSAYPEWHALHWYYQSAEVESAFNKTSYSLQNVQRSANGQYECNAQNAIDDGAKAECKLEVQYPAEGVDFPVQELEEGDNLEVVCDADANPPVSQYGWRRDSDNDFRIDNNTLTLKNVERDDADTYKCFATNVLTPTGGSDKTMTSVFEMEVFVKFSPMWTQYALDKFTAYLDESAASSLVCDAEGYPEVTYSWTFNGGTDPNWVITEEDGKSILEISSATSSDLGTYKCEVKNSKGTEVFDLQLLEPGIPDQPQHCEIYNRSANEVTFSCIPGYNGGTSLGSHVETKASDQDHKTSPSSSGMDGSMQIIRTWDLYPETTYTFYLFGKNDYGRSEEYLLTHADTKAGDPPPQSNNSDSDLGAIIGVTIGLLIGLGLLIALAAYAYWRYQPKIKDDQDASSPYVPLQNSQKEYEDIARRYARQPSLSSLSGVDNPTFNDPDAITTDPTYANYPSSDARTPRMYSRHPNGASGVPGRSQNSSIEDIGEQNYANNAYEMRSKQTNLAGMGALSHRSAQNLNTSGMRANATSRVRLSELISEVEEETTTVDGWEFPREKLFFREKLGEGAFGEVWKASAEGITVTAGMTTVAVKQARENCPDEEKQALIKELDNMKLLKPHPNVVKLYGCCTVKGPVLIIMEYIPLGNLQKFLHVGRMPLESTRRLRMQDLVGFCSQVASGMDYVSAQGLLHRDLAARNVLLDEKLTCKVCDFGLARDIINSRQYESKTQRRLPIRWMAPESLFDNIYSTKSDVWAFGVLIWEVITLGSSPYPGMSGPEVMDMISDGRRMRRPTHCSDSMYVLMRDCWRRQGSERPTFKQLHQRLDAISKELDDDPKLNTLVDSMRENMHDILLTLPGEKC